ncbi:MAG: hypothetical protein JWL81_3229 [Verrucomicrobiales bacterium]|nr:hypothetical protein [Verrucomicrobiales bacterium]
MKTRFVLTLLAAVPSAFALPYAARTLPAGFNAATVTPTGIIGDLLFSEPPVAVDFMGNGSRQWYAGGTTITRFPEGGLVTLPGLALSVSPSSTVVPLTGVPCDVDMDGDMDIARINRWNGHDDVYTLQVFLNNGGGGFLLGYRIDWEKPRSFNPGSQVMSLVAGDFNSDGFPDLAILEKDEFTNMQTDPWRDEGKLYIRWNDRSGQFPAITTLQGTGFNSMSRLSAGDFDRDGDLDLTCDWLAAWSANDTYSRTTRAYLNDGTGVFTNISLATRPSQLVDLDLDGWLDLADESQYSWNNGAGAFGVSLDMNLESNTKCHVYADADGDGVPDLVRGEGKVLAYHKIAVDGAPSVTAVPMVVLPSDIFAVGAADSDADGDLDFFVTLKNGGSAFVENRALHLMPGALETWSSSFSGATQLKTADFNLDGCQDLLAVTPSQEKLWVMYGEVDGTPAPAVFKNTQGEAPHSAAVADFNNDGRPDVTYSLPAVGTVRLAANTGNTPFGWTDSALATGLPGVSLLAAGQHGTPNGLPDLLTGSGTTGQLRWLYQSNGTWNGQSVLSSFNPVPGSIMAVQATAKPGDEPFLLAANAGTLYLRGYQLNPNWVAAGTGLTQPVTDSVPPSAMVWADGDHDGDSEAVFVGGNGFLTSWDPIKATGYAIGSVASGIRAVAAVDWDRNGYTDFLCATGAGLTLFHHGKPSGQWNKTDLITRNGGFTAVTAFDLNRDGWMDAAATDSQGTVRLVRNVPQVIQASVGAAPSVELPVGKAGAAIQFTAETVGRSTPGTWLNDADAVLTGARLIFNRAVPAGGSYVPGPALTQSELAAAVSSVSLLGASNVIGSSGPAALTSGGNMEVDYHPVFGKLVPIAPSAIFPHSIRLTITPNALQSGTTRFFVTLTSMTGTAQDGQNAVVPGEGQPVRMTGNTSVLVTIVPDYTPLQAWRAKHFGAPDALGQRANDADWDHDGVLNLVEYATGTDPTTAESALNEANALTLLPLATPQSLVKFRLVMDNAALSDSKLRVTIQQSTGLNVWSTQTSHAGATSWTGSQPVPGVGPERTTLTFTPGFTPQTAPKYFLRLKAEELP